jgi:peptide/nickel transport system substrate-binding protein
MPGPTRSVRLGVLYLASLLILGLEPVSAQVPPDVLVVGQSAEPRSMDPHTVTAANDFRILVNIYDGLVAYEPGTLTPGPALAESWDIAPDGRAYTFHLREGVQFHDGTPFDAEAVVFNFERMLDESHPQHGTGPFPLAFFFDAVSTVTALDTHTVRFELDEPFAPFLSNLAYPTGLIVSPEAVRSHGEDYGRNPSGTGPFRLAVWESRRQVALERNPEHWGGEPPLRGVVFRPITDPNAMLSEMLAGNLDLILEVSPDNLNLFRDDPSFAVHEQVGPHLWFLILNTRDAPFDDVRMRQAVNYAIDKETLVTEVLQGTATPAAGPIPAAFEWAHSEQVEPYPYDPERARELIAEAGHEGGVQVTFYVTEGGSGMLEPVTMGTAIQADLAAVGIDARIETYEWNAYLERVNAGLGADAHMAEMAWMTNDPDTLPYLALRSDAVPDQGGFNAGYYANPEVDALIEQARRVVDQGERAALYREIQAIVHEDAPWAFVASWKQNAVTAAGVSGFGLEPSFLIRLGQVRKD